MNPVTKSKRIVIYPSWQTWLFVLMAPLFVLILDTISAIWTKSEVFSTGILNVTILFYLILVIGVAKIIIISNESIIFGSHFIFIKKLPIEDIHRIDAKVDYHYSINTGLMPIATLHFLNDKSENLYNLGFGIFSKKDTSIFLNKIILSRQNIVLDNNAKLLLTENDKNIQSEIKKVSIAVLSSLSIVLSATLVILGIIYLLKK